jgi:hypothetical protein
MAELHRVEINEKVQGEIEPDDAAEAVGTISEEQAGEEQQVDRPDWLPEKFKSPEDMAQAYSELEKKMGQGTNEEQPAETTEENEGDVQDDKPDDNENADYNAAVVDASKEFFENDGQLSEETYEKLAKAGLPKELVDSYAAGQQALLQSEEGEIKSVANGQFDAMAEWANDNLEQEEINAFDDIVTTGTKEQAKFAVKSLYDRYTQANGSSPKLVQGAVTGGSTMPFKSMQELARAQSDPRYKSGDKAYHEEIDRRLSVSRL